MKVEPQEEHHWLQKLVGEWTYEAEMTMKPGDPPKRASGTETVRSLGGLWIVGEHTEGLAMDGSGKKYQDIVEVVTGDHRILRGQTSAKTASGINS